MSVLKKTNAMRILESCDIPYSTALYEIDEENLDALTAAMKLGVPAERVYKTIVMKTGTNEVCVFCISADAEVSLKKARKETGAKEIAPVRPSDLLSLTGYVRGGCSPIGMKHQFRTFIDECAFLHDTIYVSAGCRGVQIVITPDNLVKSTKAIVADIVG